MLSIPDFFANAGGAICAMVEYHHGTQGQAFTVIEEKIRENTLPILEQVRLTGQSPRAVAENMALARLQEAQGYRRS